MQEGNLTHDKLDFRDLFQYLLAGLIIAAGNIGINNFVLISHGREDISLLQGSQVFLWPNLTTKRDSR